MKTIEIIVAINSLSDETETNATILSFLNDAMAKINIAMNAELPYLNIIDSNNAPVFSEKWQRSLLIPFGVGRVKQKDSSQFEYSDAYQEFENELGTFKQKYKVPTIYKCLVSGEDIILADGSDYTTQEDDTLASISLAHNDMSTDGIINANKKCIRYVEDGISSDVYDKASYPWHTRW